MTYGSGVILQVGEEGMLSRAELTVTCVFVGICHAVIEETILLAAAGTSGALLVTVRALAGFLFAFGTSSVLLKKA
ncbi:MAG TPA: hypothetical protein VD969_12730 [Symbiobacteriaceae bacterium]|nr:hypothetical protein [Symbiobacteriaceae bacterium]